MYLLGVGEFAPPARKGARPGFTSVLMQLEETQKEISQSAHDKSACALADSASIFSQADIPAIVSAIFTGSPVVPDGLEQLLGAVLLGSGAGAVEGVFFGLFGYFAPAQFLAFPPHGQELPTTAQSGFLGSHANPLDAPACQAPVFFDPTGIVFSGKKKAGAAGLWLSPEYRLDCL